ncbi:hypothetical protein A8C32_18030 [Flavivirga aquatica]|uniref:DUF3185 domain-containing protein n=1 Tax=Flavivirga aquatica TaxID=1849968 RepID=A0A1E5T7K9_9FLAO|nr:hypothetical protein [Flavivirga aquatica]OEK07336.1 hypothetical protein A8C32_18030 [Flavivirga aquatica]
MKKPIKNILLIIGIILSSYGFYMLVAPEASVDFGSIDFKAQDNTNAFITIGIGIATLITSFIAEKKV